MMDECGCDWVNESFWLLRVGKHCASIGQLHFAMCSCQLCYNIDGLRSLL